jgi:hypothetical protein
VAFGGGCPSRRPRGTLRVAHALSGGHLRPCTALAAAGCPATSHPAFSRIGLVTTAYAVAEADKAAEHGEHWGEVLLGG